MSNLGRIEQLLEFCREEPDEPFNFYALALEYQNSNSKQAGLYFEKLLERFAHYLPTYYHAAMFYAQQDEIQKAKSIYEKGIELAKEQKNAHALRELQNAYQNFLFEYDPD